MDEARTLLEAGRLADAVNELNRTVRLQPGDTALRTFLFELLCFQGDLDRAAKQLGVIATQTDEMGTGLAVQGYRALLMAEAQRRAVFHGDALPKFIMTPPAHVERYLLLLKKLGSASGDEIGEMLEQAEETSPSISGERDGRPFSSFRDADDRIAGVLEVFHGTEYLWVPLDQVTRIDVAPPKKLRDLMWAQARLQVRGEPAGDVTIPTCYVDSYLHSNDSVKLGRITEWEALHDRMVLGQGQRVFLIDDEEVALLDLGGASFAAPAGTRSMNSNLSLDLELLLAPIPGSQPAGADLRYEGIYDRIKAARRAADDKHHGKSAFNDQDDKLAPDERAAAAAELRVGLRGLLIDTLTRQSKDLQLAVWLLEVETHLGGFIGAAGATELITRLLQTFWDTCYPAIQEDDEPLALRVGVMEWINERLPEILKSIPLSSGTQKYSLAHYELAEKSTDEKSKSELAKAGRPSLDQFVQAMTASSAPHLEATAANVERCLAQVIQLEQVADTRFVARTMAGGVERSVALLSFSQVRKVLDDCQFQVGRALRTKAPRTGASVAAGVSAGGADAERYASVGEGDEIWGRALQLVMQGQLEGLRLAQNHIDAAASGRERFLRQLQLSELCLQAGMHAFAYPILDDLGKIIDQRDLVTWEDADVIRRTWSGLATVCRSLARLRPDSVAREAEAQQRLSALATDGRHVVADT